MRSNSHAKFCIFLTVTAASSSSAFQLQQHHVASGKHSTFNQRGRTGQPHHAISSPTLDDRISPIMGDEENPSPVSVDTSTNTHHQSSTMTYFEACRTLTSSILSRIGHMLVSDTMLSPRKHLSQMLLILVTQIVLQDVQWRMLRLTALLTFKLPVYALSKHKRMRRLGNNKHAMDAVSITDLPSLEEDAVQKTTMRQLLWTEFGHYLLGTYCLEW